MAEAPTNNPGLEGQDGKTKYGKSNNTYTSGNQYDGENNENGTKIPIVSNEGTKIQIKKPIVGFMISISKTEEGEYWVLRQGQNVIGVLDLLYLKNGEKREGVIIEQNLGVSVKIQCKDGNFIYGISEIKQAVKVPNNKQRAIFKQSAFLDVVILNNGSFFKGIITEQTPGESIKIATIGNSEIAQSIQDVSKIQKKSNPYKELVDNSSIKLKEPEYIGDCFWMIDEDSIVFVEKEKYVPDSKKSYLFVFENSGSISNTRVPVNKKISFLVRTRTNDISANDQIYIFKIDQVKNGRTLHRGVDTNKHLILNKNADRKKTPLYIDYDFKKYGEASFIIEFEIEEIGEYAIYVAGSEKSFALFGVDNEFQNINNS